MNALRNKVSLIGRLGRDPEMITFDSGKSLTRFSMATHQKYKKNWHNLSAWGRWVQVLRECGPMGASIAIEGRIVSQFYFINGKKQMKSEIEINDLVIL